MLRFDGIGIWLTIKIVILAIVIYNIVTAWDVVIDGYLTQWFGWKNNNWDNFKLAIIITIISAIIFFISTINPVRIIGVDCTVYDRKV